MKSRWWVAALGTASLQCGMSINAANLPDIAHVDPDPPPETVPMTAKLSAYRSMSIHVVAAEGVPSGTLDRLREKLVWAAESVKRVPAVVDGGAMGALDLRATVQHLEQEHEKDGEHVGCEAVVKFDVVDGVDQRLLASFTVTAEHSDQPFDKAYEAVYRDVAEQLRGWLIFRAKKD